LLHLVGSSVLLYLIDDARSNTNQGYPIQISAGNPAVLRP